MTARGDIDPEVVAVLEPRTALAYERSELVRDETAARVAALAAAFAKLRADLGEHGHDGLRREAHALDFDDLIMTTVNLLQAFPAVAKAAGLRAAAASEATQEASHPTGKSTSTA